MWVRPLAGQTTRADSRSHLVLVHPTLPLPSISIYPFSLFFLPLSLVLMLMINPYDRYVSDNSSSDNSPSRTRISFSRKAAPVVSLTTTSATSTGQENRSPTSCVPFPSTPLPVSPTETCRDALYIPCPGEPLFSPELTEHIPSTRPHRRLRSNSGLISIQQRKPRPLATLNSESRASVGCIDLGKSNAVLSITASGTVSRVDNNPLSKILAISRQRRIQQLRNPSMITKRQAKKASMDAKFLIILHHSITWHIENRSDVEGPSLFIIFVLDPWRSGILTIGKSPSTRITRARRSRRAPRPKNIPTPNAKGPDRSSGPQIRSSCEWGVDVPSPDPFPHNVRPVRSKSVFPLSSASSRSGHHDDASDRRRASYETSGSSHEDNSPQEPHRKQDPSRVKQVALVPALLTSSHPYPSPRFFWFLSGFRVSLFPPFNPRCLFHPRFTTQRLDPFTTPSKVTYYEPHPIHQALSLFFFLRRIFVPTHHISRLLLHHTRQSILFVFYFAFMYILVFPSRRLKRPL